MNWKKFTAKLPAPLSRRPVLLIALAAVALAGLWLLLAPSGTSESATAYYEVKRGDFTVSVVEGGTLAAVNEVSVRNEVEGTARVIYIAKEGSYVKKGDLLVELDSSQAQDQVNVQRINAEKATNALVTAQLTLDIQRSQTNSDISAAQLKLQLAKLDLDKFDKAQASVSLLEATNKLVQVAAQLAVIQDTYTNTVKLAAKGYETKMKEDSDRLSVLQNQNALVIASNEIFMLVNFDLRKQRATFLAAVEEAQKELDRVLQQSENRIAQYESDLITQSNTLVLNQKKLERDEKNLGACKIYAPQDGLVVYAISDSHFSSESLIEEGATVRNRQELIKLPNTSRMKVTVKIHESNINLIRAGQPALVVLDSMPDTPFRAVVEKVGLLPDSQSRWGNPNLKVYNTEVVITDPLPDVKPGISAKAEIIVTNVADAISVPIQAVTTLKGRQVVYLANGGEPDPRAVEVGLFSTKFIQILSGIAPGDRVLLSPPLDTGSRDLEGSLLADSEKARTMATNAPARAAAAKAAGAVQLASDDDPPTIGGGPAENGSAGGGNRQRGQPDQDGAAAGVRGGGGPGFDREAMMKQFDKNNDGQIDETERAAMREAMGQRFGQGGPGGAGGAPNAGGRGAMPNREEMLKRFDKNGDGEIDESEREAMRAEFGRNRPRGTNAPSRGVPAPQP